MRSVALTFGLICGCLASLAEAGQYKIGGIVIDVPTKFEGPVTAQPDARARTYAFTVGTASPLLPSTVLQVTVYNATADGQAGGSADISKRYLLRMLRAVERRRTEYQQSAPKEILLAGFPGSEVSWQGKANGIGTNGKMFCITTKSELLFFHVMGGGSAPNADMAAAIKAVESAESSEAE
jgi:hypothetical protein